tara:strand:- start:4603 stop:4902 length:300 start_codon:yes stop_codon:yes gene_type:complete
MYDDEKAPKTILEAEQNILACINQFLSSFVKDEFAYDNWNTAQQNKFDKAVNQVRLKLQQLEINDVVPVVEDVGSIAQIQNSILKRMEPKEVKLPEEYL